MLNYILKSVNVTVRELHLNLKKKKTQNADSREK